MRDNQQLLEKQMQLSQRLAVQMQKHETQNILQSHDFKN